MIMIRMTVMSFSILLLLLLLPLLFHDISNTSDDAGISRNSSSSSSSSSVRHPSHYSNISNNTNQLMTTTTTTTTTIMMMDAEGEGDNHNITARRRKHHHRHEERPQPRQRQRQRQRRRLLLESSSWNDSISNRGHHPRYSHADADAADDAVPPQYFRILYIVTSGGKFYGGAVQSRFQNQVRPVILETVQSLMTMPSSSTTSTTTSTTTRSSTSKAGGGGHPQWAEPQAQPSSTSTSSSVEWRVDVSLVLGYRLLPDDQASLERDLQAIHPSIGLSVWSEAVPLSYNCKEWKSSTNSIKNDPVGRGTKCKERAISSQTDGNNSNHTTAAAEHGHAHAHTAAAASLWSLQHGKVQLARQHRYVVKDQLANYDYFMAFEDDMLLTRQHVEYHRAWMERIRHWTSLARIREANTTTTTTTTPSKNSNNMIQVNNDDEDNEDDLLLLRLPVWQQPLTAVQLQRFRPGFIRVEVLQDPAVQHEEIRIKEQEIFPMAIPSNYTAFAEQGLDPNLCCARRRRRRRPKIPSTTTTTIDNNKNDTLVYYQRSIPTAPTAGGSTTSTRNDDNEEAVVALLKSTDLMIWETNILGLGVRQVPGFPVPPSSSLSSLNPSSGGKDSANNDHNSVVPDTIMDTKKKEENQTQNQKKSTDNNPWLALLPGPKSNFVWPQYWSGNMLPPEHAGIPRPRSGSPKLIAQSAGWMASPREILEWDDPRKQICTGGSFLPPFDPPQYQQDGLYRNNVEYWSGGIQLWAGACNIQRFVALEDPLDFSKHLIYHTSNNKQEKKKDQRVLATTLLAQLRMVQEQAEQESSKS